MSPGLLPKPLIVMHTFALSAPPIPSLTQVWIEGLLVVILLAYSGPRGQWCGALPPTSDVMPSATTVVAPVCLELWYLYPLEILHDHRLAL